MTLTLSFRGGAGTVTGSLPPGRRQRPGAEQSCRTLAEVAKAVVSTNAVLHESNRIDVAGLLAGEVAAFFGSQRDKVTAP